MSQHSIPLPAMRADNPPDGDSYICPDCAFEWPMQAEAALNRCPKAAACATPTVTISRRRRRDPGEGPEGQGLNHGAQEGSRSGHTPGGRRQRPNVDCKTELGSMLLKSEFLKRPEPMAAPIAVIDFETTGMAPAQGARATRWPSLLMEGEQVVDRFDSLMRTGVPIPPFIEQLTGIQQCHVGYWRRRQAVMRDGALCDSAPMVAQ